MRNKEGKKIGDFDLTVGQVVPSLVAGVYLEILKKKNSPLLSIFLLAKILTHKTLFNLLSLNFNQGK